MMNILLFIIFIILFVVLTPGVLVSLPPKSSKLIVAITHGFIFALVWVLVNKFFGKPMLRKTVTFKEGVENIKPKVKESLVPGQEPPKPPMSNPVIGSVKKIN
jgi:hypothetical protein